MDTMTLQYEIVYQELHVTTNELLSTTDDGNFQSDISNECTITKRREPDGVRIDSHHINLIFAVYVKTFSNCPMGKTAR